MGESQTLFANTMPAVQCCVRKPALEGSIPMGVYGVLFRIDMYTDGTLDLMLMIIQAVFKSPKEKEESYALAVKRAKTRYFPAFEKVSLCIPNIQTV